MLVFVWITMVIAKPFLSFGWRAAEDEGRFEESPEQILELLSIPQTPSGTCLAVSCFFLCQPACLQSNKVPSFQERSFIYLFLKLLEAKIACFFPRWTQMNSWSLSFPFFPFVKFNCTFFDKCGLNGHSLWWPRIVTLGKIIWKGRLLKKWRRSGGQFILGP